MAARVTRPRRALAWLGCAAPLLAMFTSAEANIGLPDSLVAPSMKHGHAVSVDGATLALSLADAVYLGLRRNREIRSAYLQRIGDKFDLRVAEDRFSPRLTISSTHKRSRSSLDGNREHGLTPVVTTTGPWGTRLNLSWSQRLDLADQAGRRRNDGLSVEIVQPLLKGAGREVGMAPLRQARLGERKNRLALQAMVAKTVNTIVTTYHHLLKAQEEQRLALDALARTEQLLEVNDALIAAGRMAAFERVQTEAELAAQQLAVEEARNQLDSVRLQLLQLLALDHAQPLRASEALMAKRIDIDGAQALRVALTQQPDYLQQLIDAELHDINLQLAQDQQLWDVSLIAGASQQRDFHSASQPHDRRWNAYAGLQVEVPIGDSGARQKLLNARLAVETQVIRQEQARQQLEREVRDGLRDIDTRWRQYEIAQRGRDLSQRKLDIEREKLQVGRSSNFQVLSFESDLRRAEASVLNALIACLSAQITLDEVLGMTLQHWEIALND